MFRFSNTKNVFCNVHLKIRRQTQLREIVLILVRFFYHCVAFKQNLSQLLERICSGGNSHLKVTMWKTFSLGLVRSTSRLLSGTLDDFPYPQSIIRITTNLALHHGLNFALYKILRSVRLPASVTT